MCRSYDQGPLSGRQVVYLAAEDHQRQQQYERRQAQSFASLRLGLPAGMAADDVIAVLRQIILLPKGDPKQWGEQLKAGYVKITAAQVRQVIQHYALEKT